MSEINWGMGGYGLYVYGAYCFMTVVVLLVWIWSRAQERQALINAQARLSGTELSRKEK